MRIDRRQLLKFASLLPLPAVALSACGDGNDGPGETSGTVTVHGQNLYYVRRGKGRGTPLVFMHGGLGVDHQYFRPWLDALAETNEVIYYDHLGNGKSDRPANFNDITLARLSADCDGLTTALGLSKFVLVGHSYGGFVAQDFALRYQNRLAGLALVCTAPDLASFVPRSPLGGTPAQQMAFGALSAGVTTDAEMKANWETAVPLYYNNATPPASVDLAELGSRTVYSAAAYMRGNEVLFGGFDMVPRLSEIKVPTSVQYGKGDLWRFGDADKLAKNIPGASLTYYENSGHFPFQEETAAFLANMRSFVVGLPK